MNILVYMLFSTHVNIAIGHIPKSKIIYSVKMMCILKQFW